MVRRGCSRWIYTTICTIAACGPAPVDDVATTTGTPTDTGSTSTTTAPSTGASTTELDSSTGGLMCEGPVGNGVVVTFAVCEDEACSTRNASPWWPDNTMDQLSRQVALTCTVATSDEEGGAITVRLDDCVGDETPIAIVVVASTVEGATLAISPGDQVEVAHEKSRDDLDWLMNDIWSLRRAGILLAFYAEGVELPGFEWTDPLTLTAGASVCDVGRGYCWGWVTRGEVLASVDDTAVALQSDRESLVGADGTVWQLRAFAEHHLNEACGARGTYWNYRVSAIASD